MQQAIDYELQSNSFTYIEILLILSLSLTATSLLLVLKELFNITRIPFTICQRIKIVHQSHSLSPEVNALIAYYYLPKRLSLAGVDSVKVALLVRARTLDP